MMEKGDSVGMAIGVWTVLMRWIERKRRWDKMSIYILGEV